jgi:hypothetical protein
MTTLKASETRIPPDAFNRVAYQHERVRIDRRGGRPVFLVSEEDLELLEKLEDRFWAEEGRKALAEFKRSGQKAIPLEKVRKRLGL